jgi:hypothetical protein
MFAVHGETSNGSFAEVRVDSKEEHFDSIACNISDSFAWTASKVITSIA